MHPLIEEKREEIAAMCRRHRVLRLDVFGSAARDDFQRCDERLRLPGGVQPAFHPEGFYGLFRP